MVHSVQKVEKHPSIYGAHEFGLLLPFLTISHQQPMKLVPSELLLLIMWNLDHFLSTTAFGFLSLYEV